MGGCDDADENATDGGQPVGRETLAIVLDSIEKANARATTSAAAAVDAVQNTSQRVFLIVLAILLLLAAVLGVAVNVDTPTGSIGLDPSGDHAPELAPKPAAE